MSVFVDDFNRYLSEKKDVSANTLESYLRDVNRYIEFIGADEISDICMADTDTIESFINELRAEGKSAATVTRSLASLRAYYRYLMIEGLVETNPAKQIKLEPAEKKQPEILTEKEIRTLLAMPNDSDLKGMRDKAMLELLYATGIRVSELIGLDIDDVRCSKNERGEVICHTSRGIRTVPMHDEAAEALNKYITSARPLLVSPESGNALFINLNGSRLSRQGFWKIIKNYAEAAMIKKEITPHTLRHSFAIHLYQNGASLSDLQRMLGHADISSTQVYANMYSQSSCNDVYDRCHPLASRAKR